MKLLIVDDQPATHKGLRLGVDWAQMGIDSVETCQNAMSARLCFKNGPPDILLCDIEMPVENGVEFCSWVRQEGFSTEIIFLTCHSDFIYAKEAVRLGALDYILQPAPYNKIRDIVQKAIDKIDSARNKSLLLDKAQSYIEQKETLNQSIWRGFLNGVLDREAVSKIDELPDINQSAYLVLFQILRWNSTVLSWEASLFSSAFKNFLADVFPKNHFYFMAAHIRKNIYSIVINPLDEGAGESSVAERLSYLCGIYDMYMPCEVACYVSDYIRALDMPASWEKLLKLQRDNVTGKKGIFSPNNSTLKDVAFTKDILKLWSDYLIARNGKLFEEEISAFLDETDKQGMLNSKTLTVFYQDLMHLLYSSLGIEEGGSLNILNNAEAIELSRNAMNSLAEMKSFVHYIAESIRTETAESYQEETVRLIIDYINNNLENCIRKEDIVDVVHLNTDYITKLFKSRTGFTIKSYIIKQKLEAARALLKTTSLSVSYIAVRYGYNNFSHFSSAYKKQFGISSQDERKK